MSTYFDNAASTAVHPEVFGEMTPYFLEHVGNACANNAYGRKAKTAIEESRNTIAPLLNARPEEIIFTSSGTEANNMALTTAIAGQGIDHIITTPFEHSGVLQTLSVLQKKHQARISYLKHDGNGNLDLNHLEYLLRTNTRNLISVMHANNLTGQVNNLAAIGDLSSRYKAYFHSDTIQTIGKLELNFEDIKLDFASASAHKFHGPKGIGFLFSRKGTRIVKLIHGNDQERQIRAGTENVAGIVGLAKSLEIAYRDLEQTTQYLNGLKNRMLIKLREQVPGIRINGIKAEESLATILSISFPLLGHTSVSNYLDNKSIIVSGNTANPSKQYLAVFQSLGISDNLETVRFSFSRQNTAEEIDFAVENLALLYRAIAA